MAQKRQTSNKLMLRAFLSFIFLCALTFGCSKSPVLYPNEQLLDVGKAQAEADIRKCMELAEEYSTKPIQGGKIAKNTAFGAAGGAVGGAVGGAIAGNVGTGVATGAASGAAVALFYSLFQPTEPTSAYKTFVNKCLNDKGYETIGWE